MPHSPLKRSLREPIPEIYYAAKLLDAAVASHCLGKMQLAAELVTESDLPAIRQWTESLWGKASPYVQVTGERRDTMPLDPTLAEARMPGLEIKRALHLRDGYHCRFCGIPVIRSEIRRRFQQLFPTLTIWGAKNTEQHAAFQAMWAQYDHVVPHARGGTNDLDNLVVTCAPCNFGRMQYLVEEVGLEDPRNRPPVTSTWTGLEELLNASPPSAQ